MDIESNGVFEGGNASGKATGSILISNTGPVDATDIEISARFSDGELADLNASIGTIAVNATVSKAFTLTWTTGHRDSGTVLVEPSGGPPLAVPFTIRQTVNGSAFGWGALFAAVIALILTIVVWLRLRVERRDMNPTTRGRPPLGYVVYPGTSWSFTGSWATSLTGVGAILGLLLAASGFVGDVLPGLATGLIAGVNLGYLLLVALAPVVYKALHDVDAKPTYLALLLAGFMTLWAVIGELVTIAQLTARGGVPKAAILVTFSTILVFLYLYDDRSTLEVLIAEKPTTTQPQKQPPSALL